jgi:hypothetical protein
MAEPPLVVEVLALKQTCEPSQTDKRVAVKLAVGDCAKTEKTENKKAKKNNFFIQLKFRNVKIAS